MSISRLVEDGREHVLAPGLPLYEELPGYHTFAESSIVPSLYTGDCGDQLILGRLHDFGWGGLAVEAIGPQGVLEIGLGFSDFDDEVGWNPDRRFVETADEVVAALPEAVDGCDLVEEPGSEAVVAKAGPQIDGVREVVVWQTRTDEGFWSGAIFSMEFGFVGSVVLVDYESPVDFEDIRTHLEDMAGSVPAVVDRLNGCIEYDDELTKFSDDVFLVAPGTSPLARQGDECAELNFGYLERRGYTLDGSSDQISRLEIVSEEVIDVGDHPVTPVVAGGVVWVPNALGDSVSVIDIESLEVVTTVGVGEAPMTPVATSEAIWVPNTLSDSVSVIDIETFEVATIDVGDRPLTPTIADGLVWVPNELGRSLSVIDPDSQSVIDTVSLGTLGYPGTPLAAAGRLWVPFLRGGRSVAVVDIASREVIDDIEVGEWPHTLGAAGGRIWVSNADGKPTLVIDIETLEVVDTLEAGRAGPPITADGLIWVDSGDDVTLFDPESLEIVDTLPRFPSWDAVAIELEGMLWFHNELSVFAVDIERRRVRLRVDTNGPSAAPVMAGGRIWLPNLSDDTVTVLEAQINE